MSQGAAPASPGLVPADAAGAPAGAPPWGTHAPPALARGLIALARRSVLGRGTFRPLMARLVAALGNPVDVELHGCRWRLDPAGNASESALLFNPAYNRAEIAFLLEDLSPGEVFLDIGCNAGLYSLPAARRLGPAGRVIAIDANPVMAARIAFNAAASGLGQVVVLNCAVGGAEGRVALDLGKGDLGSVRVAQDPAGGIPMRPLLALLRDAGVERVAALKIDIEGHEDQALVPYLDQCPEPMRPRRIVIEKERAAAQDYAGCAAAFARHGYRLAGQTRANSLYRRD